MGAIRRIATSAAAVAMAAAGAVGIATPAHAGGNGQQLVFVDKYSNAWSIYVYGYNQNGAWTQGCFNTPEKETVLSGYWWKGSVSYQAYYNSNCTGTKVGWGWDSVPVNQPESNYYYISLQ